MPDDRRQEHTRRDSESLVIIGSFFSLLAILVLIGTAWEEKGVGMGVAIAAGAILLLVGLAAVFIGLRLKKRSG